MHFVLLATFVVGGDLIAADEQAQRVCRVANLHAEIGGLWTIDVHRELRFPRVERRVDVHHAGQRLHTFDEVTADGLELLQIGSVDQELDRRGLRATAADHGDFLD